MGSCLLSPPMGHQTPWRVKAEQKYRRGSSITRLSIGGSVHDPTDPTGKLFFGMLSLMGEFETDLIRARTREGMAEAQVVHPF